MRPRGESVDRHPSTHAIEVFQRNTILNKMGKKIVQQLWNKGMLWSFARVQQYPFNVFPQLGMQEVVQQYVEYGISDAEFNGVFTTRWGSELLRRPIPNDELFDAGVQGVVCDTWPYLLGIKAKPGMWWEPAKVVFRQTSSGLQVAGITTYKQGGARQHFSPGSSTRYEWLWAKRMAIATSFTVSQLVPHLVHGHLMTEAFVALAYKYLTPHHYVFRWLEPLCSDVGFINRSWGLEAICDMPNPDGLLHRFSASHALALNGPSCLEVISRGARLAQAEDVLWFESDGAMYGGNGVSVSTPMPYRDTAVKLFHVMVQFAADVVNRFWDDEDHDLAEWWKAVWSWEKMSPLRKPLDRENVAHFLATICFNATYRHDHAHDEWILQHHVLNLPMLRKGDVTYPESYLPTKRLQLAAFAAVSGLVTGNIENPFDGHIDAFPELNDEALRYVDAADKIIFECGHKDSLGTMTH